MKLLGGVVVLLLVFGAASDAAAAFIRYSPRRQMTTTTLTMTTKKEDIENWKSKAALLRAEAAALEREHQAELIYELWGDDNKNEIGIAELKRGLEKAGFPTTTTTKRRLEKLLCGGDDDDVFLLRRQDFDDLKIELDAIAREETIERARLERELSRWGREKELAKQRPFEIFDSVLEWWDCGQPTLLDRTLSVFVYLLPLLEGLMLTQYWVQAHADSPKATMILAANDFCRTHIEGGYNPLILGIIWSCLIHFPRIHRLLRFNLQQSYYLAQYLVCAREFISAGTVPCNKWVELGILLGVVLPVIYYSSDTSFFERRLPDEIPFLSLGSRGTIEVMEAFFQDRAVDLLEKATTMEQEPFDDSNSNRTTF